MQYFACEISRIPSLAAEGTVASKYDDDLWWNPNRIYRQESSHKKTLIFPAMTPVASILLISVIFFLPLGCDQFSILWLFFFDFNKPVLLKPLFGWFINVKRCWMSCTVQSVTLCVQVYFFLKLYCFNLDTFLINNLFKKDCWFLKANLVFLWKYTWNAQQSSLLSHLFCYVQHFYGKGITGVDLADEHKVISR